jgi:hypothetical protein
VYANNYSWGYDKQMNAALRDTGEPPAGAFGAAPPNKPAVDGPAMYASLQKQFAAIKPFKPPVKVHRGITVSADVLAGLEASARKAMATGGAARMPGFISTSTKSDSAFDGNVKFEIMANQGIDLKPYSHFAAEEELLLNHNTKFRVKSVDNVGGQLTIKMEQIPSDEQARTAAVLDGKGK